MEALKANFEKISRIAHADGVELELLLKGYESLLLSYQKDSLDRFESTYNEVVSLRLLRDGYEAYAYTENLSEEGLRNAYRSAFGSFSLLPPESQKDCVLPRGKNGSPERFRYDGEFVEHSEAELKKMARALANLPFAIEARVKSVPYNGLRKIKVWKRVLNSRGADLFESDARYNPYVYPLLQDGEKTKMVGETLFSRNLEQVSLEDLVRKALDKTIAQLGARQASTGNYPIILDERVMSEFLANIAPYLSAKNLAEGKSLFSGYLNKSLTADCIDLFDDPECQHGVLTSFDDEGYKTEKTTLIERGILRNFLTNSEYAAKFKFPHTKSAYRSFDSTNQIAPSNLVLKKGDQSLDDLLRSVPQALYISGIDANFATCFKASSGDFSLPAHGFFVSGGSLTQALDQFVLSGNILNLLKTVVSLGNTYDKEGLSRFIAPKVLIESLSIAGGK